MTQADIAIVGLACRFPGDARSPTAFYDMLLQGRDARSRVPASRFNIDAFHHPALERRGNMVCDSGYFLHDDVSRWDAPFFACSAVEASAMDPQQRLLLEVAYESLESAGMPVESVAGSETACFVGGFTNDYKNVVNRDINATPKYAMTGTSSSMLANRVSWFYDLTGPSMTTDTACSSSMAALHLACETIRSEANGTRCALVGGTNLMLDPNDPCSLNALGFLSADSHCFAFDARANGYARGEGICVMVLKHMDDALRDGDAIRAVIRASGVNSDGRTAGIVLPNGDAQQRLMVDTYRRAGLDPADTQYVELHGTGTRAGDPTEVGAVARSVAAAGPRPAPLYCGSVKTQIGHTEAVAALAGVLKCVLSMEGGVIPPTLNLVTPNPRLRLAESGIVVPTEPMPWPDAVVRRCSVNSFGFGGLNAHVVLDGARGYLAARGLAMPEPPPLSADAGADATTADARRPFVLVLSAPEQDAVARQVNAHALYAETRCSAAALPHLAHTLGARRSVFQWRKAAVAASVDELAAGWRDDGGRPPVKAAASPAVSLLFTGQGAQWPAMGRELLALPVFAASVRDSAAGLAALGCPWDALAELTAPEAESRLARPEFSQPLCTVLQMALVDLVGHWGVRPASVAGHSSGEIAAAYAAGALSRLDCLKIAFHRGLVSEMASERSPGGAMMAVGLGPADVQTHLGASVTLACVNSPSNVTLAGDRAALERLRDELQGRDVFCRLLQVQNAYHSPQMQSVADEYRRRISDVVPRHDSAARDSAATPLFFSSVLGRQLSTSQLTADYWVANLCSPVQLVDALDGMLCARAKGRGRSKAPVVIVEVGPHAALAGPLNQFKLARGGLEHVAYHSLLSRGQDAARTALGAAAALWERGVAVDLKRINESDTQPAVLTDLPAYCWNHSSSYWHESRMSRNHRSPPVLRHDLIGSRLDTHNPLEPVWRNHVRLAELPWLRDHKVHGDIVFPAAGFASAVIEAVRQLEADRGDMAAVELREMHVSQPLVLPDTDAGVEVLLHLKRRKLGMGSGAGPWLEFSFYSCQDDDVFVEHASGLAQAQFVKPPSEIDGGKELREQILDFQRRHARLTAACAQKAPGRECYDRLDGLGLHYGKHFQGITEARSGSIDVDPSTAQPGSQDVAVAFETKVVDSVSSMPASCESDYLIHPTTLDCIFQPLLAGLSALDGVQKQAWVPTRIESMQVSTAMPRGPGTVVHGICDASLSATHELTGDILAGDGSWDSYPGLVIEGLRLSGLGATQDSSKDEAASKLYATVAWKPDLDLVGEQDMQRLVAGGRAQVGDMARFCADSRDIVNDMCRLTLGKLSKLGPDALPPHLQKYVAWMRKRSMAAMISNATPPASPSDPDDVGFGDEAWPAIDKLDAFVKRHPVDGQLMRHVFASLDGILAQQTVPIAALMANDNFARFYKEAYGVPVNTHMFGTWFDLRAHKTPSLRVLEVGAGTASTTVPVLRQLGHDGDTPRFANWTFTDISPGWFEKAKTLLHEWKSHVDYRVLDIERDPVEQGFEAESYDVVLAVNVLHATRDIGATLANCRRLLKPGGNLVLGEYTNPDDMTGFIFGVLPGWWAAEDGRQDGPLLTQAEWHEALRAAGFSGTDMALSDSDGGPHAHRMSTMVSTKPHAQQLATLAEDRDVVVVLPHDNSDLTAALASSVCHELTRLGARSTSIQDLASAAVDVEGKTVVSLVEYQDSFLDGLDKAGFEQVKQLMLHSRELLWVTRSDSADGPGHPSKRIVSGLLRCVKTEDTSRRVYELHFNRELASGIDSAGAVIGQRLSSIWLDGSELGGEMETVERDGAFCISRYLPDKDMDGSLARTTEQYIAPQMAPVVQAGRPLKLKIRQPGMLDTLHLVDDDLPSRPLGEEEVDVEVRACSLNFRDILVAVGEIRSPDLGYEAAGIVRSVGAKVTRVSPGDRVVLMKLGAMRTCLRTHETGVHVLPASMSLEESVSIPTAYATAYQCLVEVARMRKGESVLIHAAAGGLGQATIQIAKMLEADIFCTVSTEAKKQTVMSLGVRADQIFSSRDLSFEKGIKRLTRGRGVDVVVNSLAGEALRKSWACVAPRGRFIEVGKRDIDGNTGLDMRPFLDNKLFACVNLVDMIESDPRSCEDLLATVLRLFDEGRIDMIRPIEVHDFSDVEAVFRYMQRGTHTGKLVLRITPESRVPVAPRREVPLSLRHDATYLLVGGLGGLGRAQALFMAEHGARHLAFVSRSGAARPEARDLLARLAEAGVDARAYAGDVADEAWLRGTLADMARSMPPVRGVIQGAMVLEDSLFDKMDHGQWVAATRPKIPGSWNLHRLLPRELDFFVVLSSLAGIVGSISQANYAAGNTYQDALVHYRRAKGLPAQSLDLGAVQGIGYVAEHDDVATRMNQLGLTSVDEQRFYHLLRCALAGTADGERPLGSQLLVGAGSGGMEQRSQAVDPGTDCYWLHSLRPFAYLRQLDVQEASGPTSGEADDDGLLGMLRQSKSMDEAAEAVQDMLLARIAKIMTVPLADINTAKPVHAYGVDSLVAVELRSWVSKHLRSDVSIFDLTGQAPISALSRKIAGRSHMVSSAAKGQGQG